MTALNSISVMPASIAPAGLDLRDRMNDSLDQMMKRWNAMRKDSAPDKKHRRGPRNRKELHQVGRS